MKKGMYDLHMHTLLSDGEMLPIELVRRAAVLGYGIVGISDHADSSNLTEILSAIKKVEESATEYGVQLLCGVELTHIPPSQISVLAHNAKQEGADIVIVHGETVVEPVAPGTNAAACRCEDVDVLAHPGLITEEDAHAAVEHKVALEVTSRGGHNRTNGYVVQKGRKTGCVLVINSDAHGPGDLLDEHARYKIALGSGMDEQEAASALSLNINRWLSKKR